MQQLLVLENPKNWSLEVPGARVVSARDYLTDPGFLEYRRARVFNLCRTYRYQSLGYYVSLLAEARGHRPLPSVNTLQDLRLSSVLRVVSEDLELLIQRALGPLRSDRFVLSIYFGRNLAKRYDRISQALFDHFPTPFLRAEFLRSDQWRLQSLRPIATSEVPATHRPFVAAQAERYFSRPSRGNRNRFRYDLGILVNPEETDAPSDPRAIRKFMRAAERLGIRPFLISRSDAPRLAEYDALFIRETTSVNHHTYRFSRRAEAEGLVVIDDPVSILRCTNKVYQAELFERYHIPCPKTLILNRENASEIADQIGFPVILKRPDSSFSQGVKKAGTPEELEEILASFFADSELVVAQAFTPSTFDWRIGVLDGRALYACRYYMARGHWQILKAQGPRRSYGKVETLTVEEAPRRAVKTAVKAAGLIGNGLYGVDLKEVKGRFLVMEVNDNPSIDAGCEDAILKDGLYQTIMQCFLDRLDRRGRTGGGS